MEKLNFHIIIPILVIIVLITVFIFAFISTNYTLCSTQQAITKDTSSKGNAVLICPPDHPYRNPITNICEALTVTGQGA